MSETLVRATIISSVSLTMVNESRIKTGRCPWKDAVPTPPGGHARTHNLVTPRSKWSSCHFPPLFPVSLFHSFRNLFSSLFSSSGKRRKISLRKGVKRARDTSANFKAVEFDAGDDGLTSSPSPLPTCSFAGFAEMRVYVTCAEEHSLHSFFPPLPGGVRAHTGEDAKGRGEGHKVECGAPPPLYQRKRERERGGCSSVRPSLHYCISTCLFLLRLPQFHLSLDLRRSPFLLVSAIRTIRRPLERPRSETSYLLRKTPSLPLSRPPPERGCRSKI